MTRRPTVFVLTLVALSTILAGCDLLGTDSDTEVVTSGVYVANAGGFRLSNSSLTIYNPSTEQTQRLPADDPGFASYIQSITMAPRRFYLLFGGTNSVGVFNAETSEQVGQITGIRNPRYMVATEERGYVTGQDYSASPSPKLYQIDRSSGEVVDSVEVGGSPEGLTVREGKVYVALGGRNGNVAVVNAASMTVEQTVPVECDAPRFLSFDRQGELLVFCAGSTIYNDDFEVVDRTDGAIRVLDPATPEITTRIPLDTMLTSASQGQRVFYTPRSDEAFAVLADQTVLRFDAGTNEVADRFSASGAPIGTIAYDARAQRLYIGRGAESDLFSAGGTVTVHRRDGTMAGSFEAGVAPIDIGFRRTTR